MVRRSNFVEIGTVACCNYGPNAGKICVILDVQDPVKVLVDGPDFPRGLCSLRHLAITAIKCPVARSAKTASVTKCFEKADIQGQWAKTSWAKKLARQQTRGNLGDFDRFKVMVLRKKRSAVVGKELAKLKKSK